MNAFARILMALPQAIFYIVYEMIQSLFFILIPRQFRKKKNIEGQNILITGAGSGVGQALAIEFSKHSVCLILIDINKESLMKTKKLLNPTSSVSIYECDVSNSKMVYRMVDTIKEDIGDVDILINNAGIVGGKYLTDLTDDKIRKTLEVNTLAHFWTCKAFLPAMMTKNRGHIVSITSCVGKVALPQMTDYCTSKYAAIGFAESLEVELRARKIDGIKVTIVYPSHINTGLFDGFRFETIKPVTPKFVAEEVVSGVLEEMETIFVPHWIGYLVFLSKFCSRPLLIRLMELTGDIKCMDGFRGRPNT